MRGQLKRYFFWVSSPKITETRRKGFPKPVFAKKLMARIFINENGQVRDLEDVEFVEKIIELKNTKDPWIVIDELLQFWAKKAPDEVEAITINVTEYKEALKDKVHGQTEHGKDQERRFKLSFPLGLQNMIRTLYSAEELAFDEKFYQKFAKRYSFFKVAEKV